MILPRLLRALVAVLAVGVIAAAVGRRARAGAVTAPRAEAVAADDEPAPGRARRVRGPHVLVAAVLAVAVVLGVGAGGTFALWRDAVTGTVRMPVGVTIFGAGTVGSPTYATTNAVLDANRNRGSVTYSFGPAQATALYNSNSSAGGSVAIPMQVTSLQQGHRGLAYTVAPSISGGVFGSSTVTLYKVTSAAACTTSTTSTAASSSTPWSSAYTASTTPSTEYWCLVAKYVPTKWSHTDTASVTATGPGTSGSLSASSTWTATSAITFDPALEPTHTVTFTFTTFRPGTTP
ncbi:hypothetical protein [Cellulomonas composti]|uniref:Uncharacterized protein n=1 Tax=Cellulomonas composti TaxID=266130 RepID=A0A511JE97_9CELL|nr:hypothetical protein [Cellulomonas composti]GEL96285.1 hypothetical protein CCO02nite_29430 [Cellulomonas composti]